MKASGTFDSSSNCVKESPGINEKYIFLHGKLTNKQISFNKILKSYLLWNKFEKRKENCTLSRANPQKKFRLTKKSSKIVGIF